MYYMNCLCRRFEQANEKEKANAKPNRHSTRRPFSLTSQHQLIFSYPDQCAMQLAISTQTKQIHKIAIIILNTCVF